MSIGGDVTKTRVSEYSKLLSCLYDGVVVREVGGSPLFHRVRPSPPIAAATTPTAAVMILDPFAKRSVFRLVGRGREREPTLHARTVCREGCRRERGTKGLRRTKAEEEVDG